MSDKLTLLKHLDRLLYKPWLEQIEWHRKEAEKLNQGKPVSYLFFKSAYAPFVPNKAVKEYLKALIPEFAPVINERATVNAYLLRYTNQVPAHDYFTVLALVPEQIQAKYVDTPFRVSESLSATVWAYQQMPEYNLIKKRVFLGGMYGS